MSRTGAEVEGTHASVAIIGGGIVGLSLALFLTEQGVDQVVVLERDRLGRGSTSRSAGGIRRQFGSRFEIEMTLASLPLFERIRNDLAFQGEYEQVGYAFLAGESQQESLRQVWKIQRDYGFQTEWIERDQIAGRFPYIEPSGIAAATFSPEDCFITPQPVVDWLAAACREQGVMILEQTAVAVIDSQRGRLVYGADNREIQADLIVIAAGAWSGEVAKLAGLALPIEPQPRFKVLTGPHPELPRDMPLITDLTTGAYVRSWGGHAFVGVKPPRPVSGFDLNPGPEMPEWTLRQATKRFPSLANATMENSVTGLYEITPDGLPLAGPIGDHENIWVIAGFNGHGIMHGPAVALASAEQIARGSTRILSLDPLDPERFRHGTAGTIERINLL